MGLIQVAVTGRQKHNNVGLRVSIENHDPPQQMEFRPLVLTSRSRWASQVSKKATFCLGNLAPNKSDGSSICVLDVGEILS